MLAKSKLFKRVGSFLFAFLMLFTVFASALPATVHADEQARFIDRVTISYKDRIWTSINPYNFSGAPTFTYVTGPVSCRHILTVSNIGAQKPTASAEFREKDDEDNCTLTASRDKDIQFSATGNKFVNAYRLDDDYIFVPVGFLNDPPCTTNFNMFDLLLGDNAFKNDGLLGAGVEAIALPTDYRSTTFRRPTQAQRQQQDLPANQYRKVKSDGVSTDKVLLETGNGPDAAVIIRAQNCVGTRTERVNEVVLANNGQAVTGDPGNCVPRTYGAPQKACGSDDGTDPTEPPDDGGDGANGPSCEEANSSIIVSWIVCGLVQFFDDAVTKMATIVDNLLAVDPERYNNAKLRESWSYFRNIASFMLIIIGLVMIIGQAVSKE